MRSSIGMSLVLGSVLVGAGACGDDVNHVEDPQIIPGGGVGEGAVKGELNVFVVDAASGAAIPGATVRVGAAAEAMPLTGTTDTTGLVIFAEGSLEGPQAITATASGYAAATWIGANGASVTVPLNKPEADDEPMVQTATVRGTITGWDALPAPSDPQHALAAFVFYSFADPLDAPENRIQQGTSNTGLPKNLCVKAAFLPPQFSGCAWEVTTRTGKLAMWSVVFDIDTKGTPTNQSDDTMTIIGYGLRRGLNLSADQVLENQDLAQIDAAALADITITFQDAPAGLGEIMAAPILRLGDEGQVVLAVSEGGVNPDSPTIKAPALIGDLATATYDIFARATGDSGEEGPSTAIFRRGADVSAAVDLGAWLPTPASVTASAGTYSFMPAAGASAHVIDFLDADREPAWNVVLLDGSTSFSLPALSPDPLPAGELTMLVQAFDVPALDLTDFSVDAIEDALARVATNNATFTH